MVLGSSRTGATQGCAHGLPVQICVKLEDKLLRTIFDRQKGSKLGGKSHILSFPMLKVEIQKEHAKIGVWDSSAVTVWAERTLRTRSILILVIVRELQKRMYGSSCFFFSRNESLQGI